MSDLDAESAHLKEMIDAAFREVPYPGDDIWALAARCVDVSEEERVVEILAGKKWEDWKDRPLEALTKAIHMPQLSFLSDAAFHYYLPLYMLVAAFHPTEADVIPSHLIGSLARPDDPKHFYNQRMRRFSEEQLRAILHFIEYYTARYADKYDEAACRAARDSIAALLSER